MAKLVKSKKYEWHFENIGGSTRVKIVSGSDIEHLGELDPKMWTVLSCPVSGLEIEEASLRYADNDNDGKIRVNDILATSKWLCAIVENPDILLEGRDNVLLTDFKKDSAEGQTLAKTAKQVLTNLGKSDSQSISLADTVDVAAIFARTRFNGDGVITAASSDEAEDKAAVNAIITTMGSVADRSGAEGVDAAKIEAFYTALEAYKGWNDAKVDAPYGEDSDKLFDAYKALDAKVKDFFLRSRLAAFSPASAAALDIQTSRIEAISSENLLSRTEELASYPLSHISAAQELDLKAGINPVWADRFEMIRKVAFANASSMTEEDWNAFGRSFDAYSAWKASKAGAEVEPLGLQTIEELLSQDRKAALLELVEKDLALKSEAESIATLDKFLHLLRDFGRLLRNFVTLQDFYDKNPVTSAVFQCGTLIVDQRACHFCMKVADMAKHNAMAPASGMFLVYCDCTSKSKPAKLQIVAAVTVGEVGDLTVGKNAIFYDNSGCEWDAVITKVIDNPISIGQAFWSPYRRMAKTVENLINKRAADKDAEIMKEANAKINEGPKLTGTGPDGKPVQALPFDIGKFAGIIAAFSVALGAIGTALVSVAKGLGALNWWQVILCILGILLAVSGPSMVMAWLKLRRRNIAPLLNANGWAVNASSRISILFGESLTEIARFPKLKLKDPYAAAGLATWQKVAITVAVILAVLVLVVLWLCNMFAWAGLPTPLHCCGC